MNISHLKYTWAHKKAFLKVEKEVLGHNTISGYIHDMDKILLYLVPFLDSKTISRWHRSYSNHHLPRAIQKEKYILQSLVDWECAAYTKPDKPLNAIQTLDRYYSLYYAEYLPVLDKYPYFAIRRNITPKSG